MRNHTQITAHVHKSVREVSHSWTRLKQSERFGAFVRWCKLLTYRNCLVLRLGPVHAASRRGYMDADATCSGRSVVVAYRMLGTILGTQVSTQTDRVVGCFCDTQQRVLVPARRVTKVLCGWVRIKRGSIKYVFRIPRPQKQCLSRIQCWPACVRMVNEHAGYLCKIMRLAYSVCSHERKLTVYFISSRVHATHIITFCFSLIFCFVMSIRFAFEIGHFRYHTAHVSAV